MTRSLRIHCSVHDTLNGPDDIIIGRRDDSVHQTHINIDKLASLVVMHDGKDVASINQKHPSKVIDVSSITLKASGNLTDSSSGVRGYLELQFDAPDRKLLGEFICEASAVSPSGHILVFRKSLRIDFRPPTLSDVIDEVWDLRKENSDLKAKISNVIVERIPELEDKLMESRHVESGSLQCGNSYNWKGRSGKVAGNVWYTTELQKFQRSYDKPPIVFLSVTYLSKKSDQSMTFAVSLSNVTSSDFTIKCSTHRGYVLTGLGVDWISVAR